MESQIQLKAIRKLAVAGEQAGFTLDQMIQLLNSGMSVVTLLDLIAWRLGLSRSSFESFPIASGRAQSRTLVRSRNDCS